MRDVIRGPILPELRHPREGSAVDAGLRRGADTPSMQPVRHDVLR